MFRLFESFYKAMYIEAIRWVDYVKRRVTGLPTAKHSQITHQLYVGGQYGLKMTPKLKQFGITAIVNMRKKSIHPKNFVDGFAYLHLPTSDWHAPTLENLEKGVTFIKNSLDQGGKVYIHCRLGEGRGPTMALAYLVSTGLTFEDAFLSVKKVRPFIRLTRSQVAQIKYYATLKAKQS